MLTEFDKLKRVSPYSISPATHRCKTRKADKVNAQDYQEHQNEIHAKLVAIMSDRLAVHCGSLRVRLVRIIHGHFAK